MRASEDETVLFSPPFFTFFRAGDVEEKEGEGEGGGRVLLSGEGTEGEEELWDERAESGQGIVSSVDDRRGGGGFPRLLNGEYLSGSV